jgi:hypothetical protein
MELMGPVRTSFLYIVLDLVVALLFYAIENVDERICEKSNGYE